MTRASERKRKQHHETNSRLNYSFKLKLDPEVIFFATFKRVPSRTSGYANGKILEQMFIFGAIGLLLFRLSIGSVDLRNFIDKVFSIH